jgi:hypothetical protein
VFSSCLEPEADGLRVLVAAGTSCHEQLQAGMKRRVFYPTELLAGILQSG